MSVELFTLGVSLPRVAARQAAAAEHAGFDGILYVDSQNLSGDTYVALATAAAATSTVKIGTGVTNPFTRHPAVTAGAIATIQAESDGRAVLGIGRGDSSLAHLGLAPAPPHAFERYLERVQAYLRREAVVFADGDRAAHAGVEDLGLAAVPEESHLSWLRESQPKVPVDVAATGPKVIAIAARVADRLSLAVGADPVRVAWGVQQAREAMAAAGRDPSSLQIGAYVNLGMHPDRGLARRMVSGGLSTFARFSVMHGTTRGPIDDHDRETLQRVRSVYDMRRHTQVGSPQADALDPEFIDRFAVVGDLEECAERLHQLLELGLSHLILIGGLAGVGGPGGEPSRVTALLDRLRAPVAHA